MSGADPEVQALHVAIVDYRSGRLLEALLASLAEAARRAPGLRLRVVVVDNAASDTCAASCRAAALPVERRVPGRNLGFGEGMNHAVADATSSWLLCLNSDAALAADFLEGAARLLPTLPEEVAIVGPALRNPDGSPQPSVGSFPDLRSSLLGLLRPRAERKYVPASEHRAGPVDWVTGACLLVRRSAFEALAGFDPGYFLYYEEVDLCRRAREVGLRTWFAPELAVVHVQPFAQRETDSRLVPVVRYSQLRWFRAHRPRGETWLLWALVWAWTWLGSLRGGDVDWAGVRHAARAGRDGGEGPRPGDAHEPRPGGEAREDRGHG